MNSATRRYLDRMMGRVGQGTSPASRRPARVGDTLSMGPTVVRDEDPLEDIEDALEDYDRVMAGEPRRRKERNRGPGLNRDGEFVFDGRECCGRLMRSIDKRLHRLHLPHKVACPECGAGFSIDNRLREPRHHGR